MIGTNKKVTDEERDDFLMIVSAYASINTFMNQVDFGELSNSQVKEYISGIAQAWVENKYNEYLWRKVIKEKYDINGRVSLDGNTIVIMEEGE